MTTSANNAVGSNLSFEELYLCDASKEHYGFSSWDSFFTRQFRPSVRPVAAPRQLEVIANACESRPYKIAYNVEYRNRFWLKHRPYSIVDMLAYDQLSEAFIGGTVYQAYLDALSYHRWHSPVDGTIAKAYVKQGAYFTEPPLKIWSHPDDPDDEGVVAAQGYLAAVATRAIILIQADNQCIGLMCALFVGMAEVSTCEITVQEGRHVDKGEQLGMFHHGGSTYCLLFRKGVIVEGFPSPARATNVPARGQLAVVREGGVGGGGEEGWRGE